MKKQTATEWLEQELNERLQNKLTPTFLELFDQAKLLEKEHLLEAYRNGRTDEQSGIDKWHNRTALQYYNDTYNP